MDDLLITRRSDRSQERFSRSRRRTVPLGANLGLILAAAGGFLGASKMSAQPEIGMAIGLAIGLALGGLLGQFLKPPRDRARAHSSPHFQGFPVEPNEERAE